MAAARAAVAAVGPPRRGCGSTPAASTTTTRRSRTPSRSVWLGTSSRGLRCISSMSEQKEMLSRRLLTGAHRRRCTASCVLRSYIPPCQFR